MSNAASKNSFVGLESSSTQPPQSLEMGRSSTRPSNEGDEGRARLEFDQLIQERVAKALDELHQLNLQAQSDQEETYNKGESAAELKQAREAYERACAKARTLYKIEILGVAQRKKKTDIERLEKDILSIKSDIAREKKASEPEPMETDKQEQDESEKDLETLELELKQAESNERAAFDTARNYRARFLKSRAWSITSSMVEARERVFQKAVASEARLKEAEARLKEAQRKVEDAKMNQQARTSSAGESEASNRSNFVGNNFTPKAAPTFKEFEGETDEGRARINSVGNNFTPKAAPTFKDFQGESDEGRARMQFDQLIQERVAKALNESKKRNRDQEETHGESAAELKRAREVYERECAKVDMIDKLWESQRKMEIEIETLHRDYQCTKTSIERLELELEQGDMESYEQDTQEEECEKDLETLELELKQVKCIERTAFRLASSHREFFLRSRCSTTVGELAQVNKRAFQRAVVSEARLRKAEARLKNAEEKVEAAKMNQQARTSSTTSNNT